MRLGVVIDIGAGVRPADPARAAAEAEEWGLDLVWLAAEPASRLATADALTAAAFIAPATTGLRLVALCPVGPHPIHIAEQAAVADNATNGRLVLALGESEAGPAVLEETAEIVLAAGAPRPFAHAGVRWTVPGHVADNTRERRLNVTPKPAQLRLPMWLLGTAAPAIGAELGLSHVAGAGEPPERARQDWRLAEERLGRAAAVLLRPALRDVTCAADGDLDDVSLTESLLAESEAWGLDVAILRLPTTVQGAGRRRAIRRIASLVRPSLMMDQIPEHVRRYWQRELVPRLDGAAPAGGAARE